MGWPGDRVVSSRRRRGRSGLHRARWWVTPTRGDSRDSATENRPPPGSPGGKGETVVQETTSDPGDRVGSANPTWSKVKKPGVLGHRARARLRAARPSARVDRWRLSATAAVDGWSPPGRPQGPPGQNPAYRPARPHHRSDLREPDHDRGLLPLQLPSASVLSTLRGLGLPKSRTLAGRDNRARNERGVSRPHSRSSSSSRPRTEPPAAAIVARRLDANNIAAPET